MNRASLNDTLSLAKKLTLFKVLNFLAVYLSYTFSKLFKINWHFGLPVSLSVEPTTSCNLRCPECPSGLRSFTRPTGMLADNTFEKIIDELSLKLIWLTLYFQGEPFLNTSFLKMVKYASQKNLYTSTSTNAHYINKEIALETVNSGLNRLIISIDGTTQESYEAYRIGGKLEKVIDGTKNIIEAKKILNSKIPFVVFQFLVVKPNEHQIPEVFALAKQLGVDKVVLKTAQIYDYENGSPLIPQNDKYSRYKKVNGKYKIKNNLENSCWKMWHSAVITWDGNVVPCCFDKDASHILGSVKQNDFKYIWQHKAYQDFRKALLKSRSEIDICTNCTEGTKVFA